MGAISRLAAGVLFIGLLGVMVMTLAEPRGPTVLQLDAETRATLKARMHGHLTGVGSILSALQDRDYARAVVWAETHLRPPAGSILAHNGEAGVYGSTADSSMDVLTDSGLPPELRRYIADYTDSLHTFVATANRAAEGDATTSHSQVMEQFQTLSGTCRACHGDYRPEQ